MPSRICTSLIQFSLFFPGIAPYRIFTFEIHAITGKLRLVIAGQLRMLIGYRRRRRKKLETRQHQ